VRPSFQPPAFVYSTAGFGYSCARGLPFSDVPPPELLARLRLPKPASLRIPFFSSCINISINSCARTDDIKLETKVRGLHRLGFSQK
jgi:hypothetical protein